MERKAHPVAILLIVLYAAIMLAPIGWMVVTAFKKSVDASAEVPGIIPTLSQEKPPPGYFRVTTENFAEYFSTSDASQASREFFTFLKNSAIVATVSTFFSVFLGAFAAYGFSRFRIAGSKDWQFFILSTRMLPAMAVSVPLSWMYFKLDQTFQTDLLRGTPLGLVLLYTCFNLSFSTWMMKAFMDEIPTAYEEAALLDGYTRVQVLLKIVLPQASAGLLATAVFCLIASWNEYAFALTLTNRSAQTLPVYLSAIMDQPRPPYGRLAAGAVMFMAPIVVFSLLMRKHLLRGITFGAVKG